MRLRTRTQESIPRTFKSCFRNAMQSAHSCTLSKEFKHFSTCCAYFLYFGSAAYASGTLEKSCTREKDYGSPSLVFADSHAAPLFVAATESSPAVIVGEFEAKWT
jgi:hypothetical protein